MTALVPTALQLDALREVANIGCAHAANALSRLLGGRIVHIDVPHVQLCDREEVEGLLGEPESPQVAGQLGLAGGLSGELLLVLPRPDAGRLCSLLLGGPAPLELDEGCRSALGEVANIVASACLNAIAALSGFSLWPTPPTLVEGDTPTVLAPLFARSPDAAAVVLEARFATQASPPFSGQLLIVPDNESLQLLLRKLGV